MPFHRIARRSLALLLSIACATAARAAEDNQLPLTGTWRIASAVDSADITSMDDRQARRLVGRRFVITPEKLRFGSKTCDDPSFDAQLVEPRLDLREQFRSFHTDLHLASPATAVELGCTMAFVKDADKILIFWNGWFFDAVRTPAVRRR